MQYNEEWVPIPGFEGYYAITLAGQIKNVKRNRIVGIHTTYRGYIGYRLCKDNIKHYFSLHCLLLMTFVGPRPPKYQGAHLDGNKQNNHLSNLKWVTAKENHYHKKLHGTEAFGEKNKAAKLTETQVLEIRKTFKPGTTNILAKKYSVSDCTIINIVKRKTWPHI